MLKTIIATAVTLAILAWGLPNIHYSNLITLVLASSTLALLQTLLRPILKILFLPINIVTLGLFSLVINVFLLWLATFLVPGLRIEPMIISGVKLGEFMTLLLMSCIISFLQSFLRKFLK